MWKSVTDTRCGVLGFMVSACLLVGTTLLSTLLTPSFATAQDLRLDRQFPELAAALARRDPIAVRNQIDALDPQSKQRVLTALHANRWNPSGVAPGESPADSLETHSAIQPGSEDLMGVPPVVPPWQISPS